MKQHMLTHKIRDMPPGFDKSSGSLQSEDSHGRDSPDRRSSPDKIDLKRSPPAHPPPPITHAPSMDMPPLPKRPSGKFCICIWQKTINHSLKRSCTCRYYNMNANTFVSLFFLLSQSKLNGAERRDFEMVRHVISKLGYFYISNFIIISIIIICLNTNYASRSKQSSILNLLLNITRWPTYKM